MDTYQQQIEFAPVILAYLEFNTFDNTTLTSKNIDLVLVPNTQPFILFSPVIQQFIYSPVVIIYKAHTAVTVYFKKCPSYQQFIKGCVQKTFKTVNFYSLNCSHIDLHIGHLATYWEELYMSYWRFHHDWLYDDKTFGQYFCCTHFCF